VTTCSCTAPGYYWSSTTSAYSPGFAKDVYFDDAYAGAYGKTGTVRVRAVRGCL
jgi:hypothetical protein